MNLKITDARAILGDSAFLLDDGKTAVLFDTGFGFTGERVTEKVKEALGDRPLDYIFLTHSHYDHIMGVPHLLGAYPDAKVVAGAYAARIFEKPTARAVMCDLDRKFADTCGVGEYETHMDRLRVDIPLEDGDEIMAGDLRIVAVWLPGHTKCSFGFWLPDEKLLIGSETLGVFDGGDILFPNCLVGYQMALDSIEKAKSFGAEHLLLPHFGLLSGEKVTYYLSHAAEATTYTAESMVDILRRGGTKEDVLAWFTEKYYHGEICESYPIDAMRLNTSIMTDLFAREFGLV